jgi:DNA polymerase III subunit epsilon
MVEKQESKIMINRCLIVDVETTGLDPNTDLRTEVGAILYSLTSASSLVEFSAITTCQQTNPEAERLTGITQAMITEADTVHDIIERETGSRFLSHMVAALAETADVVVAHNAEFDKQWLQLETCDLPWLCTLEDFRFPGVTPGQSLTSLALALGVPVVSAHRALTDCRLISSIFTRCSELGHDLQELFKVAQRPKALFVAVDNGNFFRLPEAERSRMIEQRKTAGFKWDRLVPKAWARRMSVEDVNGLPFEVREFQR